MRCSAKLNLRSLAIAALAAWVLMPNDGVHAASAPVRLRVAESGRYLEYEDGKPFFYLGDTAWELFHRLSREEADRYLANRAAKGFTVIQAVVVAQLGGLTDPNPYGAVPFADKDPTRPNEAYFSHVDHIVNRANESGLVIGMLPTWGSYWKIGSGIFNAENARVFGRFLGQRYKDKSIIWILGGDENVRNDSERATIEAMALGLREGDGGRHLMTYHPRGPGLSSDYLHQADWLDFNMVQSSHAARDHDNGLFAAHDYLLEPVKPTLDGEPRYEGIPVGFYNAGADREFRFDDYDVRQAAYWSLLAGACGHTYGHNSVWQMWQPGRTPVIWASTPWDESLDHPGATQMSHVRRLFESRPFQKLVPDQSMILDGPTHGGAKVRAARATDGSFAFIYSPRGEPFTLRVNVIRTPIRQTWFDPREGSARPLHTTDTPGFQTFVPPTQGRGCDWVLVLEDATAGFPAPGKVRQ
ncbi:MAG: DUF4038 domain-containing protein [Pirellulaceae bacterium]|nr:DUF4038 domain-containing protein [Pirellulaceae bacterium]